MRTLLLSAVLYLTGVAAVLYFKPALMFHPDGSWKEFGLEGLERTMFPFWLFCITWAVAAFGITVVLESIFGGEAGAAAAAAGTAVAATTVPQEPITPLQPLPPRTRHRRRRLIQTPSGVMQPGYYMLDPAGSGVPGVPRYIYLGPESPGAPPSAVGMPQGPGPRNYTPVGTMPPPIYTTTPAPAAAPSGPAPPAYNFMIPPSAPPAPQPPAMYDDETASYSSEEGGEYEAPTGTNGGRVA